MWNKFKIWLNRNDFKIITILLIIIGIYLLIKGSNNYFKNQVKSSDLYEYNESNQNISIFDNIEYNDDDLNKIEKSDDEYKLVSKIAERFINTIYRANKNNDESAKKDLVNMCSARWINSLTNERRVIGTDNILIFLMQVDNVSDYSIENIYKYGEKNNIGKYIVNLKFDDGKTAIITSYMIINIDTETGTFAYDGSYIDLDYLMNNIFEGYANIQKNSSNSY